MSTDKTTTAIEKVQTTAAIEKAQAVLATITGANYFDEPEAPDAGKPEDKRGGVPYVGFRGEKSTKKIPELEAAGVKASEFYLYDNEILKIQPFSLCVLKHATFYTEQNNKMQVTNCAFEAPPYGVKTKLRKYVVGVGIVRVPGPNGVNFVPAGFQFRSAQCKAIERPIELLKSAKDRDAWAARSPKHKVASDACVPGGRFYASIWSTVEEGKYEDEQGNVNDFNLGHNTIGYPDAAEVAAFNKWFPAAMSDPRGKLLPVLAQFEGRVDLLRRKARGEDVRDKGDEE